MQTSQSQKLTDDKPGTSPWLVAIGHTTPVILLSSFISCHQSWQLTNSMMSAEEEDVENIMLTPEKANDDDEPVDDNETGLSQKKVSIADAKPMKWRGRA